MHARNRTWPLGSDPAERCRQRTMPVEGGDGSTLSLDFTSGVLDPRLTLTRGSNATFINSSGLVQWANANFWFNTAFDGISGTDPTLTNVGWQYVFSVATTTFNGDGTVTISTTGGTNRGGLARVTSIPNTTLRLSTAVDIVAHTGATYGTLTVSDLFSAGAFNDIQFYIDGNPVSSTTPISGPCTVTWVFERTGGGTITPSFGVNLRQARTGAFTLRFANPRFSMWGGVAPLPYYANTSSGASPSERHDPRFDYDPTSIGTPRGLLIEAAANNLSLDSENFSAWSTGNTSLSSESGDTNPDGITVPTRVSDNSTNGEHFRARSPSLTTATTYTKSVWFKNPATNGRRYGGLQLFAGGGTDVGGVVAVWDFDTGQPVPSLTFGYGGKPTPSVSCVPYKSGWYRVSISMTVTGTLTTLTHRIVLSNGTATSYANSGTALGLLVWGAQLETGSGASSYIPTGASTGSRSADNCVTAIANLTGFNANQGTIYEAWRDNTASDTSVVQEWAFAFGLTGANGVGIFASNVVSGTFGVNGGISNSGDAGPAGTYVIGGLNKAAIAIDVAGTSMKLSANGSAVATGTNIGGYNTAQTFSLGQRNNNTRYLNGWIRQFKYWPYLLPDAQLTNLTT